MDAPFHLGCAVWGYKDWVGRFFPSGSRSGDLLRLYGQRLTAVEGNTTFYAQPRPEIVQRWAEETPESFRFCLKLPREVSHSDALARHLAETQAFVELMQPLGPRLGPFFLQLPSSFAPDQIDDLAAWLDAWPAQQRIAVEVRHLGWFEPDNEGMLMALLDAYGAGRVIMDVRPLELAPLPNAEENPQQARDNKPRVPMRPLVSGGFSMVRYIGHPTLDLNSQLIDEWAARVAGWLADGVETFFFMHCPIETYSPELCRTFQQRLEGLARIAPLPWDQVPSGPEQLSMFD